MGLASGLICVQISVTEALLSIALIRTLTLSHAKCKCISTLTENKQCRMAGSGVALRLHEFKESQDTRNHPTHLAHRQGRDVLGLYPGQFGRVHTVSSHLDRSMLKTPDMQHYESRAVKKYQRSNFDLLSLQASLQSHHRETHTSNTQSIGADFQKFTLSSHPEPLEQQQR